MDPYKITINSWNKVAEAYQKIFMDLDLYDDTYNTFIGLLNNPEAKIFEIGCGPGNITRYLLSRQPQYRIHATDVSPEMIALAQKNNPSASFQVLDCRDLSRVEEKHDAVMCGFCLPYLSHQDCNTMLHECNAVLNDKGLIYLSAIEGDDNKSGYETGSTGDKMYVYYYSENALRNMLEANGYAIKEVMRKEFTRSTGEQSVHLIIIAEKHAGI